MTACRRHPLAHCCGASMSAATISSGCPTSSTASATPGSAAHARTSRAATCSSPSTALAYERTAGDRARPREETRDAGARPHPFAQASPTDTVARAPSDHGSSELRSEVLFLKHPLTAASAIAEFPELREGVDSVAPGPGAIYFSRVRARATQTRFSRVMAMPIFHRMSSREPCVRPPVCSNCSTSDSPILSPSRPC